jgi:hypothetical protein
MTPLCKIEATHPQGDIRGLSGVTVRRRARLSAASTLNGFALPQLQRRS